MFISGMKSLGAFLLAVSSDNMDDVMEVYEHALLSQWPRARYVVGNDAKYMWLPLQWLPEWISDHVLQMGNPFPTMGRQQYAGLCDSSPSKAQENH